MIQINLSDRLADFIAWVVTPETIFDFDLGNETYFGSGRKVNLKELEERCLTPKADVDKIYEINVSGSCLFRNPSFLDFLCNRPPPKILQERTRSKNFRYIK
jgi:hypothetical protein